MSLEASIAELNSNIKVLIGVLNKAGHTQPVTTDSPAIASAPATPTPEKTEPSKTAQAAAPAALDYTKDVQPLVLRVSSTKGRDTAVAVLAKLGLKSAKEAKPEQYQQLIDACQEALK